MTPKDREARMKQNSLNLAPPIEAAVVFTVLFVSAILGGGSHSDWLSATAVFLSFLCSQAAFDLAEAAAAAPNAPSSPGRRYRVLYLTKEVFWVLTCLAIRNYPLIASTVVFATYPMWRRVLRGCALARICLGEKPSHKQDLKHAMSQVVA